MIGTLVFAASAVAETAVAAEFYVVRDATTKKCTVVDTKPTTTTTTSSTTARSRPRPRPKPA